MERIAYDPPPGTPPLEFLHGGKVTVFQPPDAWWKREKEDYVFDTIYHPATGNKIKDIIKQRSVWVIDAEKTARGDRPDNTAWLSKNELAGLLSDRWAPLNSHVKRLSEMDGREAADLAAREARHREAIEKQAAAHDREKKLHADKLSKDMDEVRSNLQARIAEQADDLGLSMQAVEELINERKAKIAVRKSRGK